MKNNRLTDNKEFSQIYIEYFPKLMRFAQEYILSAEDAKNIVQDMFLYLWEQPETLAAVSNLNAFLYTLIKNRCIDYYRRNTRIGKFKSFDSDYEKELFLKMEALHKFEMDIFDDEDIELILDKAISKLPERCQQVFRLSRLEDLKHEAIAQKLNISVHTVQNHISTALRKLKEELKDYLPLFFFFI